MSEDEWYARGEYLLDKWAQVTEAEGDRLMSYEKIAFEYAWELAGREMGVVK